LLTTKFKFHDAKIIINSYNVKNNLYELIIITLIMVKLYCAHAKQYTYIYIVYIFAYTRERNNPIIMVYQYT